MNSMPSIHVCVCTPSTHAFGVTLLCSIRVIFSAADIQTAEEPGFGEEEEGESDEPENLHSYPIRVSFSITKVCFSRPSLVTLLLTVHRTMPTGQLMSTRCARAGGSW